MGLFPIRNSLVQIKIAAHEGDPERAGDALGLIVADGGAVGGVGVGPGLGGADEVVPFVFGGAPAAMVSALVGADDAGDGVAAGLARDLGSDVAK